MVSAKSFMVVLTAALAMLLVAACGAQPTPATGGSSAPGARTINVTATDFKFDPGDQVFKSGESITVNMTNKGAVDHTWVLTDSSGKELFKLEVKVGQTGKGTFTAPAPGAYNIVCDIAGHKEAGMQAKATVQ